MRCGPGQDPAGCPACRGEDLFKGPRRATDRPHPQGVGDEQPDDAGRSILWLQGPEAVVMILARLVLLALCEPQLDVGREQHGPLSSPTLLPPLRRLVVVNNELEGDITPGHEQLIGTVGRDDITDPPDSATHHGQQQSLLDAVVPRPGPVVDGIKQESTAHLGKEVTADPVPLPCRVPGEVAILDEGVQDGLEPQVKVALPEDTPGRVTMLVEDAAHKCGSPVRDITIRESIPFMKPVGAEDSRELKEEPEHIIRRGRLVKTRTRGGVSEQTRLTTAGCGSGVLRKWVLRKWGAVEVGAVEVSAVPEVSDFFGIRI